MIRGQRISISLIVLFKISFSSPLRTVSTSGNSGTTFHLIYFASYHVLPQLLSVNNGTCSETAFSMTSLTRASKRSNSSSGTSKTSSSWTCKSIVACNFSSFRRRSKSIMAIFKISAALPWIGVLIAVRSANVRKLKLRELISGK